MLHAVRTDNAELPLEEVLTSVRGEPALTKRQFSEACKGAQLVAR